MLQNIRFRLLVITLITTCLSVVAVAPPMIAEAAPSATLPAGQKLSAGELIQSSNGKYRAVMQGDGNFVVYEGNKAIWSSGTSGADRVVMQGDGNLVVYSGSKAKWSSRTGGGGRATLGMQNDGNLVIRTADGRSMWSSKLGATGNTSAQLVAGYTLSSGAILHSPNGTYRAVMQKDGNLVVYAGNKAKWSSRTSGSGATKAVMQKDGNFVVYAGSKAKWSSRTSGTGATRLVMQNDGNLVIYAKSKAVWSSKGGSIGPSVPNGLASFQSWTLNAANWNSATPAGNRGIDVDGAYGAQCADLGIAWSKQAGSPVGFDGWDNSGLSKPGWHVVAGSLANSRPGDVITRVGGIQHVVVVVSSPSNGTINVLQQNPKSPHLKSYPTSTSGVIWRRN